MKNITRRQFLKGTFAGAAGLALSTLPVLNTKASAEEAATEEIDYASQVTETMDTDIVVVGAGMSGLTAAVEALNNGASVILLEAQEAAGGNGNVTSCVMGVGTRIQKSLGIELTAADVISTEMKTFNYSVDGVRWSNLVRDSSDNIEWLIEQGCLMQEDFVDNYKGTGRVETAHWWVGETQRDGFNGFVNQMVPHIEDLGGTILYSTRGKKLIQDESGAVTGLYAETADGVLQINAKAVILATGGFADNMDYIASLGYTTENTAVFGAAGHYGDGIEMALAAGGKSWMNKASLMEYPMNPALGRSSSFLSRNKNVLWVNGKGQRFVDENCSSDVPGRAALAVRSQDMSYALYDQAQMDAVLGDDEDRAKLVEDAVASGTIFQADTIEELAAAAGIDADQLTATVNAYNECCENGLDTEFGKEAECLTALTEAPYYLTATNGIYYLTTIGGIDTTADCEVRKEDGGIVPNLYAVGVDGVELYNGLYTITIPGSCNANNIWTGRHAAQMAVANL